MDSHKRPSFGFLDFNSIHVLQPKLPSSNRKMDLIKRPNIILQLNSGGRGNRPATLAPGAAAAFGD